MRTAAKRPARSHSASVARSGSFFKATRSPGFFSPVMRQAAPGVVQTKLAVSKPADPLEKEAAQTADKVMRMPAEQVQRAATATPGAASPPIQRAAAQARQVQRFGEGTPTVAADAQSEIQRATTGGQALPPEVRGFMEPRLGAELGDVRVHADESAASLSNHLSARAFTYRNHVFFARDQYQPGTTEGRHLLAHELTHTVQQGATVQRAAEPTRITTTGSPPPVQRLGIQDALDYFADKAYNIPGYRMLTLILGFNPINMRSTPRTAANFLRALIELIPGGALITQVLDNHGVINKAAEWVEQKVAALGDIGGMIVDGLARFIDSLSWTDIFHLGDVWDRAKRIFTDPIDRLIDLGISVVSELLELVKQAILRPLAALAETTGGYDLLKAILQRDPITGEPYPRTAETLIGGFMKLIRQEEVWENIKKGNAIARAFAWFQGALSGLMTFVLSIPGRVVATLRSLTFRDVVTVVGAFQKVGSAFLGMAAEFGAWALNQVISLLEILFSVVAPGVMPYIAKARAAFRTILRNPVRFIGNLVRAGKLGFEMFAANILTHLKNALIKWLVGPLADAGVYIPKSFDLLEIIKLVLSVLGLTWQAIRTKLLKIIPEPVLVGLEKTAAVLVTLVTQGPAAAWEQIKAELAELKDQLISQVSSMIQIEVVKAAVKKLVSMLNPAGAVIQAIIAIYNTVTFFIEKAKQIGAVVASFIDSISAIAAGQVAGAAKRVEQTLASTLVVVIGFLAKFAGLGGIPEKLVGIVKKIRAPIDKGLDKIVAWLGKMLEKAKAALGDSRTMPEKERDVGLARNDAQALLGDSSRTPSHIEAALPAIKKQYKLTSIALERLGGDQFDIAVLINPAAKTAPKELKGDLTPPAGLAVGIYIKFNDQIWKVATIRDPYVVVFHSTNVRDEKKFAIKIFFQKFAEGFYPAPSAAELQALESTDPTWLDKIKGKPQTTGTPGHAELTWDRAQHFAKMLSVKAVYLDRQYRLITAVLANAVARLRRADVVVEHKAGRIDVIEVRSRSDDEAFLRSRNEEALQALPEAMRGKVDVVEIAGIEYRRK